MDKVKINYKEKTLLTQDAQKDASFMVEETSLNIQQDVIATKREIKKLEVELEDQKSSYPFDMQKYLETRTRIQNLKEGLKMTADLQKELGFAVTAE